MRLRGHLGRGKHLRAGHRRHWQVCVLQPRRGLHRPGQAARASGSLFTRQGANRLDARSTAGRGRVRQTQVHTTHRDGSHRLEIERLEVGSETRQDGAPALSLTDWEATSTGGQLQHEVGPALEGSFRDVQAPSDRLEEHQLILVDLQRVQTRDLAPRAGGVVAILEILGGEDEGGQEHAPTTLHRPHTRLIPRLLLGEVVRGHMGLNLNQII